MEENTDYTSSENTHSENTQKTDSQGTYTSDFDGLYFSFESEQIKNVLFDFSFAKVVVIEGDFFSVETRGTVNSNFLCFVKDDDTLIVKNEHPFEQFNFMSHDRTRTFPRILITVPPKFEFESLRIKMNAGTFTLDSVPLSCKVGSVKVNAGELKIDSVVGGNIDFSCGAGSILFDGTITGRCNVDCGMGSIVLNIKGNSADYSCDSKTGLGSVKLNDELLSTLGRSYADKICQNHISVNCGLGNVELNVHKF
ncbi:MAG: hypothetical protein K6A43_04955 [Treponema sp.]|nr:hypothetical protein [Treponema sp.]